MAIDPTSAMTPNLDLCNGSQASAGCNYCDATFPGEDLESDEGIAAALITFIDHARLKHLEVLQEMLADRDCPRFVHWLIEREFARA